MTSTLTGEALIGEASAPRRQGTLVGIAVLSAHGGSAATTVAGWLDLTEVDETAAGDPFRLVVVTARTTTSGFDQLLASVAAVPEATSVLVAASADAPLRAPGGVRARARALQRSDRDVALVTLPYEPSWRHCPAAMRRPSKAYRRQLAKLQAVITHHERSGA